MTGRANDAANNFRILISIFFYRYLENITMDSKNNKTNIMTFGDTCLQNNN